MDVSDIFYFFRLGEGKGESEAPGWGRGSVFFIENPRRGVLPGKGGGRGEAAGRVSVGNWVVGGAKYFFSALKFPPS